MGDQHIPLCPVHRMTGEDGAHGIFMCADLILRKQCSCLSRLKIRKQVQADRPVFIFQPDSGEFFSKRPFHINVLLSEKLLPKLQPLARIVVSRH